MREKRSKSLRTADFRQIAISGAISESIESISKVMVENG